MENSIMVTLQARVEGQLWAKDVHFHYAPRVRDVLQMKRRTGQNHFVRIEEVVYDVAAHYFIVNLDGVITQPILKDLGFQAIKEE